MSPQKVATVAAVSLSGLAAVDLLLGASTWWLVASVMGYVLYAGLGLTVGYHRYFCHRAFRAELPWPWVFAVCGILGLQDSPPVWCAAHRAHHKSPDREGDPHNTRELGWRVLYRPLAYEFDLSVLRHPAARDPVQRAAHRHQGKILIGVLLAFAAIDPRLAIYGWAVPAAATLLAARGCLVYLGHRWGYGATDASDAVNNPLSALLTFGDGWHANHHARPGAACFGRRWWEIDPGYWFIRLIRSEKETP